MIDLLLALVDQTFGGTNLYIPTILMMLAIGIICFTNKNWLQMPRYMFGTVISEIAGVYFFFVLGFGMQVLCRETKPEAKEFLKSLYGILCLILGIMIILAYRCIHIYWIMRRELKVSCLYAQPENYDYNLIEAWKRLEKLLPSKMTKKQKETYERYKMFLRTQMGSFHANELEMRRRAEAGEKDTAFNHLLYFIQYQRTGHIEQANEQIRKAEALCNEETDITIRSQILINRGVAYVLTKAYKDAEDAFEKAILFCEENDLQTSELWTILYYNYVFNKTRLHQHISYEEWKSELEILKEHLDMKNPQDYIAYRYVELEMLRQTGAERSRLEKNVQDMLTCIGQRKMPDRNRCMFEASVAHVVWSSRLDPVHVLQALNKDKELIRQFPMPARYHCYKNIQSFFEDLHGGIVKKYADLREDAAEYMKHQSLDDLEKFRKLLPSEAVYERCFCFEEEARLQKNHPQTYRWENVLEELENASNLYKENGLELEELMCNLNLIDEACIALNVDAYGRPIYKDRMKHLMEEAEQILPILQEHPVINEIALRMSYYAYRMDDYEKCKKYYEEYRRTKHLVSIEQYAPGLHTYYMVVSFAVRVLYVIDAIKAIPSISEFQRKNASIRKSIQNFMSGPAEKEYVILGMLLGFTDIVLLKRLMWKNARDGSTEAHVWFVFSDIGLEIDIAYNNIAEDAETDRTFFINNQHPLENGLSRFASKKSEQGRLSVPLVQEETFGLGNFVESEQAEMLEIRDMIEKYLPEACPTIEELRWSYRDVMFPVSVDASNK